MLTCVDYRLVCRSEWNCFGWVEVEILIGCQVGCGVCYRLWRSWNMGLCSFRCCSGMSWLLWWNKRIYICSYGSRSDGFFMCFNSVMVSPMLPYSCLQFRKVWRRLTGVRCVGYSVYALEILILYWGLFALCMIYGTYYMWICRFHFFRVLEFDLAFWILWFDVM